MYVHDIHKKCPDVISEYKHETGHRPQGDHWTLAPTCLNTEYSLRPNYYKKLSFLTWCTVSVLPLQPAKLKRMLTDCHKLRVGLDVHTHWLGCVSICCYEVQWSKEAVSSHEVWVKAWQLKRGNDLKHLDVTPVYDQYSVGGCMLQLVHFKIFLSFNGSYFHKKPNT